MSANSKLIIFLLSFLMIGHAEATVFSCPSINKIKQSQADSGYSYKANAGNNMKWTGENPYAEKNDLQNISFKEAYILNVKNLVACDYVGQDNVSGMRMSLTLKLPVKPLGEYWQDEKQSDGSVFVHCTSSNPEDCVFSQ
ncbi:DUF3757 domain-containing protein [Lonsdalea quercina]|uniref:DUF3757 domain-containing protein n=1 Tax=Lonsdalea quercina TaxID=71657 RepID=UPI00397706AD